MDWSLVPPLASLRAFEAAARHRGYSAAGRELNVSHAAVAQQVRSLESHLGFGLVERAGRGIALTPDGALLFEGLSEGFGRIAETLSALVDQENERPLHVTMTPSFAVSWFMPRLPEFREAHPEIDLMINPTADTVDLVRNACDVAIRFGAGNWRDVESEPLLPSNFVIVAAPALVDPARLDDPVYLAGLPWLQELGTIEAERWLASHGIPIPSRAHITSLPGYMLLDALRQGQGVTATARVFVENDLAAGRIILLWEELEGPPTGYHLVWRKGVQRPALKAFLRWIRQAARETNG